MKNVLLSFSPLSLDNISMDTDIWIINSDLLDIDKLNSKRDAGYHITTFDDLRENSDDLSYLFDAIFLHNQNIESMHVVGLGEALKRQKRLRPNTRITFE